MSVLKFTHNYFTCENCTLAIKISLKYTGYLYTITTYNAKQKNSNREKKCLFIQKLIGIINSFVLQMYDIASLKMVEKKRNFSN